MGLVVALITDAHQEKPIISNKLQRLAVASDNPEPPAASADKPPHIMLMFKNVSGRPAPATTFDSHIYQSCSQFPPTPRLPLCHQGRCLLSQRQLLLQPKGCFQILCLLLVTSTRVSGPRFIPYRISYSCEGIDPFQKSCSLLWTGIRPPYGGAPSPKVPERQLLLLSRQLSN